MSQQQTEQLLFQIIERLNGMLKQLKQEALTADEMDRLSLPQLYYLIAIRKLGKPSLGDLARELKVTKPSVSNSIENLHRNGFVLKLQSNEDKRIRFLVLTEKGERLVNAEHTAYKQFYEIVNQCLSQEELRNLTSMMNKIVHAFPHKS